MRHIGLFVIASVLIIESGCGGSNAELQATISAQNTRLAQVGSLGASQTPAASMIPSLTTPPPAYTSAPALPPTKNPDPGYFVLSEYPYLQAYPDAFYVSKPEAGYRKVLINVMVLNASDSAVPVDNSLTRIIKLSTFKDENGHTFPCDGLLETRLDGGRPLYLPPQKQILMNLTCTVAVTVTKAWVEFGGLSNPALSLPMPNQDDGPCKYNDYDFCTFPNADLPYFQPTTNLNPGPGQTLTIPGAAEVTLESSQFNKAANNWSFIMRIKNTGVTTIFASRSLFMGSDFELLQVTPKSLNDPDMPDIVPGAEVNWKFTANYPYPPGNSAYIYLLVFADKLAVFWVDSPNSAEPAAPTNVPTPEPTVTGKDATYTFVSFRPIMRHRFSPIVRQGFSPTLRH